MTPAGCLRTQVGQVGVMPNTNDHDVIFGRAEKLVLDAVDNPIHIPEYRAAHKLAQSLEHNGWRNITGMTQHAKIMKHLKKAGSITVREALVEYSIASLTKRIHELRSGGHRIISEVKFHPVTQQKYVRYSLEAAQLKG